MTEANVVTIAGEEYDMGRVVVPTTVGDVFVETSTTLNSDDDTMYRCDPPEAN